MFLHLENDPHICGNEINRPKDVDDSLNDIDYASENAGRGIPHDGNAKYFYV